ELYDGMAKVAEELRILTLREYISTEMQMEVDNASTFEAQLEVLEKALRELAEVKLNDLGEQVHTDYEEFEAGNEDQKAALIIQKVRELVLVRSGFDPVLGKCTL